MDLSFTLQLLWMNFHPERSALGHPRIAQREITVVPQCAPVRCNLPREQTVYCADTTIASSLHKKRQLAPSFADWVTVDQMLFNGAATRSLSVTAAHPAPLKNPSHPASV
jgi:hypothetical protein